MATANPWLRLRLRLYIQTLGRLPRLPQRQPAVLWRRQLHQQHFKARTTRRRHLTSRLPHPSPHRLLCPVLHWLLRRRLLLRLLLLRLLLRQLPWLPADRSACCTAGDSSPCVVCARPVRTRAACSMRVAGRAANSLSGLTGGFRAAHVQVSRWQACVSPRRRRAEGAGSLAAAAMP